MFFTRPQYFRAVTHESQRWTEESTTVNLSRDVRQGDVRIGELRGPVLWDSIPLTPRTACRLHGKSLLGVGWDADVIVEGHMATFSRTRGPPSWCCQKEGRQFTQHLVGVPTDLEEIWCGTLPPRVLSRVCTANGYAVTPWRFQFLDSITFESQRMTDDGTTVDPNHGLRHGCVQIDNPREPALLFSSRFLLVHHASYPGLSSVVALLKFRHDRQGSRDGDTFLR